MKKIFLVLPVVVAAVFLSGCSLYNSPSQPSTTASKSQTTPVVGSAISIANFAFSPSTLTVKKGTTVTWTNNDGAAHIIKSATFNSNSLGKGQTFSFTFDTIGTFDYACGIHPSMQGKIIVE